MKKATNLTMIILTAVAILSIAVTLVASGSIPLIGIVSATDDIDEAIEQKEEEREQAEAELEQSKLREYAYLQEGLSLAEKLTALEGDLNALISDIEQGKDDLAVRETEVEEKMKIIEQKQAEVESVSRTLYKTSRMSLIETILSSDGMTDMLRQFGFRRFGIAHLLDQARGYHGELTDLTAEYNSLSGEIAVLDIRLAELGTEVENLENQRIAYEQMAVAEAAKQNSLVGQIANITEEQRTLIAEKMAATQEPTTIGEYENVSVDLPAAPFSPAYAVASIGYPHRIGMSQYGAYGRAIAGQNYTQILSAYFNATFSSEYPVMDQIKVEGYGTLNFEDTYLKGIAEMPTYWANSGGFEALKAQAVLARTYAIHFTQNGNIPICTTQQCQVYYPPKVTDPAAAQWHRAVEETRGEVLLSDGKPITAFYASTAGGYTRLPADFDTWGSSGSNLLYLKRIVDQDQSGKAFDGPSYGNSPWYYKVWYAPSDVHPWLTGAEMIDLLNAALLPEEYNSYLSHPDIGGWTHEQVRNKLVELGISPISDISSVTVVNSNDGYVVSLQIVTSSGVRDVNGWRFNIVYKLRSRGHLALWSSLYDIVVQ